MLTDTPPRKTSSARFLQRDRMRTNDASLSGAKSGAGQRTASAIAAVDYPNSRKFFIKAVLSPNLDFVDNLLDIGYLRCHFLRFLPLSGSFDCPLDCEHAIFSAEPDVLLVQSGRNQCCLVVFLNSRVQIGRNVLGFRRSIDW